MTYDFAHRISRELAPVSDLLIDAKSNLANSPSNRSSNPALPIVATSTPTRPVIFAWDSAPTIRRPVKFFLLEVPNPRTQ